MVNVQGSGRRNVRNLATTTFSTSAVVAITLVAFLGLCLSLAECSPSGARAVDGGAGIFDPKRSGAKGFHEGIFDDGFGGFSTFKKRNMAVKRRPEMDSRGIHGDAFTGGFGDFYTMKRSQPQLRPELFLESLLEGYEGLLNRVSNLENKVENLN